MFHITSINSFKRLVDENVSTQKDDSGIVYLDFETPNAVYEQYVHGNSDRDLSYQKFLDKWKSSFPHVMTLAEKCPRIHRTITQFMSKALEDNAKCLDKHKYESSRHTQLYKQYISTEHFDSHVTKCYFYEILNTQLLVRHDNVRDAIVKFISKLESCGQEKEENGERVVYLPFTLKRNVYQLYIDTHDKELHVTISTFFSTWRKYFPSC